MHPNSKIPSESLTAQLACDACGKRLFTIREGAVYAEFGRHVGDALLCGVCSSEIGVTQGTTATSEATSSKGHILIAEDDHDLHILLQTFLADEGYTVSWVDEGYKLMAEAQVGNYDLIISDICLPNGYGDEVIPILRERGITTPVIYISGFPEKSLVLGNSVLFEKPFELAEILIDIEKKIKQNKLQLAMSD